MKQDLKATVTNAEHVNSEIRTKASSEFSDPLLVQEAIKEKVQRADSSLRETFASEVKGEELVTFKVVIANENEAAASLYRKAPTAEGLLLLLGLNAKDGDTITVVTTWRDSWRKIEHTWPIPLAVAEQMVDPKPGRDRESQTAGRAKFHDRNLGRFGAISIKTENGPPGWKLPKFKVHVSRGNKTRVAVLAGWRQNGVKIAWQSK